MCYDINAEPPQAPGSVGAAHGKDLELVTEDGTRFAAYAARSGSGAGRSQVVIFPDVRGLHRFYKELALRFAEKDIDAVAIDYFGRTAGISPRDESFEFQPHVPHIAMPSFLADVRAALAYLRDSSDGPRATFTVGFCIGGGLSLHAGTEDLDLAGVIALYAGLHRDFPGGEGTALERASKIRFPVLGLFGGADPGIPPSDLQKLDEALDEAGVEHEIIVYPDAPHSFFDRKAVDFAQESADAWEQMLSFMAAHSKKE
jgi:carboxymethylenebutenolidase